MLNCCVLSVIVTDAIPIHHCQLIVVARQGRFWAVSIGTVPEITPKFTNTAAIFANKGCIVWFPISWRRGWCISCSLAIISSPVFAHLRTCLLSLFLPRSQALVLNVNFLMKLDLLGVHQQHSQADKCMMYVVVGSCLCSGFVITSQKSNSSAPGIVQLSSCVLLPWSSQVDQLDMARANVNS